MKKVTVIGSLNIDHILKVSVLPSKGETLISNSYNLSEGGKGANQAIAIARLGVPVSIIGKVGGDIYGEMLTKNLKESDVDIEGIIVDKLGKTGSAFITVDENGNNTIVVARGVNERLSTDDIEAMKSKILESDIVVLQLEIPKDIVEYIINFSRDADKLIILNFSPAIDIDKNVLNKVDFLIMNEIETKYLVGYDLEFNNIKTAIRELRKLFSKNIIITFGVKGSICVTEDDKILEVPAYSINTVNSTGAGDAFIGGFILGLGKGKCVKDCVVLGNAAGALSAAKLGSQSSLPYKDELDDFLKS